MFSGLGKFSEKMISGGCKVENEIRWSSEIWTAAWMTTIMTCKLVMTQLLRSGDT